MKRNRFLDSRIFSFTDTLYRLIKSSLFFWLYVIKNFVILGIVVAFATLLETTSDIYKGKGDPIRNLFKSNSQKYKHYKIFSLVITFVFIYLGAFINLPLPDPISNQMSLIIKYICLYLILIIVIFLSYLALNLMMNELSFKQKLLFSFYLMIKHFIRSLILLVLYVVIFYIAHNNWIFLIFFAPGLFAVGIWLTLRGLEDELCGLTTGANE